MELLTAHKTQYQILQSLGSGLTSEVYKAFRKDSGGFTQQTVALKLIRSRNDVQILKQEFENLIKVRSKYCVQVLAWENFNHGPALVLEFIDGVNLEVLHKSCQMDVHDWVEVLTQVRLGLQSLHHQNIFHGDLNLKNIMITRQGVIKIIDFGFGRDGEQCLTPMFAAPSRMRGEPPSAQSDVISWHKLADFLLKEEWGKVNLEMEIPRAWRRRSLAQKVVNSQAQKCDGTIRWNLKPKSRNSFPLARLAISLFTICILGLWPDGRSFQAQFYTLRLRSQSWFQFSLNGSPPRYGPNQDFPVRKGQYNLKWKMAHMSQDRTLNLDRPKTFILNP